MVEENELKEGRIKGGKINRSSGSRTESIWFV